ncbi:hypothetical protein D9M71_768110 [compost metagenome]
MITHYVKAEIDVAFLWLPAQRNTPLTAVASIFFLKPIGLHALAESVSGRPVTTYWGQLTFVPTELIIGLDVQARAQARGYAE